MLHGAFVCARALTWALALVSLDRPRRGATLDHTVSLVQGAMRSMVYAVWSMRGVSVVFVQIVWDVRLI